MTQPIPIGILSQARQKPQPYQTAVIRSIESGDKFASLMATFATIGMAATYGARAIAPWKRLLGDQSPTIGRKRRARRARGRRRGNA